MALQLELLIVNFHYFREESYNCGIYPVSRTQFSHQLLELKKVYRFVSQAELLSYFSGIQTLKGRFCLITFDDGLKEQMAAFEMLQAMGIPAIFFAATDPIEQETVLPVHKLHHLRANIDDEYIFEQLDTLFQISRYPFDETSLTVQYRYDTPLSRKVKYFLNFELDKSQKDNFLATIFHEIVPDEALFARNLYMNKADLKVLAQAGALGSHGASHRPLALLESHEAVSDIHRSIKLLESWTGLPIQSFAYPFGGATAVNDSLESTFTNTNIKFALTMKRGINKDSDFAKPYFLKRVDTNDAPGGKNYHSK